VATKYALAFAFALALSSSCAERSHNAPPASAPVVTDPSRTIDSLVAASRLYGYVRWFHPTSESRHVDWDDFAARMMERASGAASGPELARALAEATLPVAPSIEVWSGAPPPPKPPPDAPFLVRYHHHGVGLSGDGKRSLYRSTRKRVEKGREEPAVVVKDLGGGVSCRVPVTLPTDETGTLPHASAPLPPSGADPRMARVASVATVWNVFEHFYPYFDVVATDWPAALRAALADALAAADEAAFTRTLRELVAKVHDGHGRVKLAGEAIQALPVQWTWASGELVVTAPHEGLARGDTVLAIDGRSVADLYADASRVISAATEGYRRHCALYEMRIARTKDPCELTVRRASGEETKVLVARAWSGKLETPTHPANGGEIAPGVVYMNLDDASSEDLKSVLPALEKAKGIVFDMRGYPSSAGIDVLEHLGTSEMTSAEWLVPIVLLPDREGMTFADPRPWQLAPRVPHLAAKVAFVIDGRAISYAESVLEVIEHYRLGALVGEPTAGTNGNINPFELPGGYAIVWTGMRVLKHGGKRHHGVGIQPTVPAHRTAKGIAEGRDEMIERAIDVVTR
jgi:C-terminal processing protease CtpA/Prc